jgi:hypothetical protein
METRKETVAVAGQPVPVDARGHKRNGARQHDSGDQTEMREPAAAAAPTSSPALAAGLFVLLALVACLSVYQQRPPAAAPAQAPAADFSAGRALRHVEAVAKVQHPVGSAEHDAVRDYLLSELRAAGLEPQVQTTASVNPKQGPPYTAGTVQNVVARLAGTENTKAILLVSHYDSVPLSPGASDDGAGVATLLEVLRALKSGAPPKNDVIFLFTDAEEVGLLGAEAFVREHPWAKDAGLVLNFEARGSRGPSFMFETSDGNGWLVGEFAKAAPHPITNSLLADVYRVLPNDTDLSSFKRAGLPSLNFAFFDAVVNYHTPRDNVEELDPRSLQHQGSYALALARHFGGLRLENRVGGNAVYFNALGATLVRYPAGWVLPLAVGLVVLFAAVLVVGFRRKRLTPRGLVAGFFVHLLSIVVSAVAITLLWVLIAKLHPAYGTNPSGDTFNSGLYMIAFAAAALALTALLYAWLGRRRVRAENLAAGALLWWLLPAVVTSLLLPGMSYLFVWPLLFALLGFGYALNRGAGEGLRSKHVLVLFLCALPGVVLLSPTIHMLYEALTLGATPAVMLFVVLLVGLLVPHLGLIAASRRWLVPGIAAALAAALIAAGSLTAGVSRTTPRQDHVFYALNADTGQAVWASVDESADEWSAQFFTADARRGALPEYVPQTSMTFLQSPAPAAPLAPPAVELLEDKVENNRRLIRLRLRSSRGASSLSLFLDPGVEVTRAEVAGLPLPTAQAGGGAAYGWGFYYYAPPAEGVVLTLEVAPTGPLHVRAVDRSYGLPPVPGLSVRDRPEYLIPSAHGLGDSALVTKSYKF